ncbi:MAG TPA: hypothetical protein HA327_00690 [Candidatus Poseidoniaceae archaeon]|nr:MAG TPA: hypothetical protein D7H81_00675 [Candidatus Poseidoniales archaeon]HII44533.1 hypothetical protein [Candidatus Poseidoniaceae archaeon]|tara:strand:- start:1778 stop:3112 length:1335 start_codon:yes stop_codon:yes gene_type:complete
MLGDSVPLFFPVLLFLLSLWLVADKVDNYLTRFSPMVKSRLSSTYRLVPLMMIGWLLVVRARAFITRDIEHVEVANRLQGTDFVVTDLLLLITGDGAGEFSLMALMLFALWTINLPSMRNAPLSARKAVQSKVMLYVSACALLTFWIFFPESNYYSPDTLPAQSTMSSSGDLNPLMVILVTLMIAFSGELFAISSLQLPSEYFTILKRRALMKSYVVSILVLLGLYQGGNLETSLVTNQGSEINIATILFLSQTLILSLVCIPAKYSDSILKVGQARTKSFAVMAILCVFILLIVTSLVLQNTTEFTAGNRYLLESLWLSASFLLIVSTLQILPRYGFDSAARPEFWWLRMSIVFAPALIYWFNQLAVFLIPSLWIIGSLTIIIPNLIEQDATSPSHQRLGFVAVVGLTILMLTANTTNMLSNFIFLGGVILVSSALIVNGLEQ